MDADKNQKNRKDFTIEDLHNPRTCYNCGDEIQVGKKYWQVPVVESPKDIPHSASFCEECIATVDKDVVEDVVDDYFLVH